jgi:hypothetical protein
MCKCTRNASHCLNHARNEMVQKPGLVHQLRRPQASVANAPRTTNPTQHAFIKTDKCQISSPVQWLNSTLALCADAARHSTSASTTDTTLVLVVMGCCLCLLQSSWRGRRRRLLMAWSGSAAGCQPGGCEPWQLHAQQQTDASGACAPRLQPPVTNIKEEADSTYSTAGKRQGLSGVTHYSHTQTGPFACCIEPQVILYADLLGR